MVDRTLNGASQQTIIRVNAAGIKNVFKISKGIRHYKVHYKPDIRAIRAIRVIRGNNVFSMASLH
jgi:hypothetical protein